MSRESDRGRLSETTPHSPLGRLLASAERDLPSQQELANLAARLGGVLEPVAAPSGSPVLVKVGASAGVAVLVLGGLWALLRPNAVPPRTPQEAASAPVATTAVPAVSTTPTAAAPPSSTNEPVVEVAKPAAAQKPSPVPAKSVATEAISEPALLEQARRALATSPATALALTNQHAARFPHGVLAQEREVIAIEALRRLGRAAAADQRAAAFARAFPGSAHQRVVEDATAK